MSDIRKKLEALVDREAEIHWNKVRNSVCDRDFVAGAHLLLDAVVEMQSAMKEYLQFKDDYAAGKCPEGYLICVKYADTLRNNMREALSSLEKRLRGEA